MTAPNTSVKVGAVTFSNAARLALIAGPCQLESRQHAFDMAGSLKEICDGLGIGLVYKSSYDKANRTSIGATRGAGLDAAMPVFDDLRREFGVPVLTDVHTEEQCAIVAPHVDVLQIPAFLCRQTDLLVAAARTGKVVNVKKGQFLAPWDMKNVVGKVTDSGNPDVLITERGASFGYNTLVSDMRALPILAEKGVQARVIDVRWLSPLPTEGIVDGLKGCKAALVVDETRRTGGVAEALMALLEENTDLPHARLTAQDSFIPTGPAYAATMPSRDSIVEAALALAGGAK